MEAVERGTVKAAGIVSPILRAGSIDAAEAVVFVHGNPGSCSDWAALMNQIAPFGRALAPDMPGFGQADKPDEFEYTVVGYARHLDTVLGAEVCGACISCCTTSVARGALHGPPTMSIGSRASRC
jgi:pimeloyl-ACP methyl ester carboxylesterase